MEAIREQLNRPIIAGVAGLILGLIIGLIIGWGIWPVQWYDAAPTDLRVEWQEQYLRMTIHTYVRTGNEANARQRWDELGEDARDVMDRIITAPGQLTNEDIARFQNNVVAADAPAVPPPVAAEPEAEETIVGRNVLLVVLPVLCVLTLLLGGALAGLFLVRSRRSGTGPVTPAIQAQEAARDAEWTDYEAMGEEPPMAQFMASYKLGDDLFDDSFSIDSPGGEFLGECGVGISETIGVGEPKKVSAFEVWLFDKNDIQTVTKVLMSTHAFRDETARQRLAAKGEPVQSEPGSQVVLETATLQLVARVVDMEYGEGALPPESFFDNIILELAVWQK
jgi:hypothetical protein